MGAIAYRAFLCFVLVMAGAGLSAAERWWLTALLAAGAGILTAMLSVNKEPR